MSNHNYYRKVPKTRVSSETIYYLLDFYLYVSCWLIFEVERLTKL